LEKSDKFSKIPFLLDILEYNFWLTHLYSNIGSFFTSGKNDLVKFILKIAGHLGVFGTLPQLHHRSKLGKEYSKLNYRCYSLIRLICIYHLSISMKICNFQKWYSLSQIQSFFLSLEIDPGGSVCTLETINSQSSKIWHFLLWECDPIPFRLIMKIRRLSLMIHTVSNLNILKLKFDFWTLTTYLAS
jgi:hypothetical protein